MAYESRIWDQLSVVSTTLTDLVLDVGQELRRPATKAFILNNEGWITGTGDYLKVRFNGDSNQVVTLNPGQACEVQFAVHKIELCAVGTSGSNNTTATVIVS